MQRVCRSWQDRRLWQDIQQNGMQRDFSWPQAARDYIELYRDALHAPRVATG
ncbi:glycogen synthase [compost metagenome]